MSHVQSCYSSCVISSRSGRMWRARKRVLTSVGSVELSAALILLVPWTEHAVEAVFPGVLESRKKKEKENVS